MPSWIVDFFNVDLSWSWGNAAWNGLIKIVFTLLTKTPEEFSADAWAVVTDTLYPWFLSAGVSLLNLFFFIGFIRQNMNLRDNITIETWIEGFIKVIISNAIMQEGLTLVNDFLTLQVAATEFALGENVLVLSVPEVDIGTLLFTLFLGLIYFIISAVCGVMVLLEVMKRFLFVTASITVGPIAICTMAGGRGLESSAHAWIKTFLTYCFQFVLIAVILRIGTLMGSSLPAFLQSQEGPGEIFDGFVLCLNNLVFMLFITTGIKGTDNLLEKMFSLR